MPEITKWLAIIALLLIIFFVSYEIFITFIEHRNSKIVLQSEIIRLNDNIQYTFIYKHNIVSTKSMTITPSKNHITLLNKSTYYNGKITANIQINNTGVVIYSAYLKDLIEILEDPVS